MSTDLRSEAHCSTGRTLHPGVYGVVERYLRRRVASQSDVEDLAQDVFLRYLASSCTPRDPIGYVMAIAKHSLADYYDRRSRDRSLFVEMPSDTESLTSACVVGDAAPLIDSVRQVNALLAKLPCSQRLVLIEHEKYGYSYQEVAGRLGFTVQTVEKYLTLAKAQLRAIGPEPKHRGRRSRLNRQGCAG